MVEPPGSPPVQIWGQAGIFIFAGCALWLNDGA